MILVAALFASCTTAQPLLPKKPDWKTTKLDDLLSLAKDRPAEAIDQAFFMLDDRAAKTEVNRASLEAVVTRAADSIADTLRKAQKDKDTGLELSATRSLLALEELPAAAGLLSPGTAELAAKALSSEAPLLIGEAETAWRQSNRSLANALVSRALDALSDKVPIPAELLAPWMERSAEAGTTALSARLAAAAGGVEAPSPSLTGDTARLDPSLVAKIEPAVITVRVDRGIRVEQGMGSPDRVLGSGFFIDPRGYLITNYHVISSEVDPTYEGYSRVTVKPSGDPDTRIPAKVIGYDPILDLALLKAEMTPGYSFVLGPGAALPQGASIYALGSPLGLESTITSGIVSAVGRNFLQWGDVIQIDAALNPGNSGGPLLDSSGRVSGVVFAGVPGYQGLNFAIPTSWLLGDLPALYHGGKVEHPWLGYILDDAVRGSPGLPVRYRSPSTTPSILEGDRIISVDGQPLEKVVDLQALLLERRPGELVSILVQAPDGSRRTVLRALGSRPEHPLDDAIAEDTRDRLFPALLGMDVVRVPGGIFGMESYTISKVRAGSAADEAGLSEGDPFTLYGLIVHSKDRAALLQIHVKKRKAGFLDSIIQIPVPLDIPGFV